MLSVFSSEVTMAESECGCGSCHECIARWRRENPNGLLVWDEYTPEWIDWCTREGIDPATGIPLLIQVVLPKDSDGKPLPF
jgi:hypothetical protein